MLIPEIVRDTEANKETYNIYINKELKGSISQLPKYGWVVELISVDQCKSYSKLGSAIYHTLVDIGVSPVLSNNSVFSLLGSERWVK